MPKRLNYNFVKSKFEERGYQLLSEEYVGAHSQLEYKCPKGHIGSITFNKFHNVGRGCRRCYDIRRGENRRHSFDFVKSKFEEQGYTLLSKEYVNSDARLEYKCPNNHIGSVVFHSFYNNGTRCPKCYDIERSDRQSHKHTFDFVKSKFEEIKYTLLSKDYVNAHSELEYKCSEGHKNVMTFHNFHNHKRRCPLCSQSRSEKMTREIFEDIMGLPFPSGRYDFLKNDETGYKLELDGYNKDLNLAFEYQGEQHYKFIPRFHRTEEKFKKQQERDILKYKKCVKLGITLILVPYKFNSYDPEKLRLYITEQLITHGFLFYV